MLTTVGWATFVLFLLYRQNKGGVVRPRHHAQSDEVFPELGSRRDSGLESPSAEKVALRA